MRRAKRARNLRQKRVGGAPRHCGGGGRRCQIRPSRRRRITGASPHPAPHAARSIPRGSGLAGLWRRCSRRALASPCRRGRVRRLQLMPPGVGAATPGVPRHAFGGRADPLWSLRGGLPRLPAPPLATPPPLRRGLPPAGRAVRETRFFAMWWSAWRRREASGMRLLGCWSRIAGRRDRRVWACGGLDGGCWGRIAQGGRQQRGGNATRLD